MKFDFIELKKPFSKDNVDFLYHLICDREFSISHQEIPSYEDHVDFLENNPYYKIFIIIFNNEKVGSIYFQKDNTFGLNLLKNKKHLMLKLFSNLNRYFRPLPAVKSFRTAVFSINISPNDLNTIEVLKKANYRVDSIKYVMKKDFK